MLKLTTNPAFQRLFTPELNIVKELFKKHGYQIRIAGGAVRDLIMAKEPADVDFATTATPSQMTDMFHQESIRMLNKRGIEHGTITCRIQDKENFEITTLRIDVVCDGRRAEVEFTTDWLLDASRRDLTILIVFFWILTATFMVFFTGIEDIKNRKVRFVGNPVDRIQEDYLRILRYFRFYGRIADNPNEHDGETLEAIAANVKGLAGLSGERVWSELKRILIGGHAAAIVKTMLDLGVPKQIGLPANYDAGSFDTVWERAKEMEPQSMTVAASLLQIETDLDLFRKTLKISNAEKNLGQFIIQHRDDSVPVDITAQKKHYQDLLLCLVWEKNAAAKELVSELAKYLGLPQILEHISAWNPPKFPVSGFEVFKLIPSLRGPEFKKILQSCHDVWIESDYILSSRELIEKAKEGRQASGDAENVKGDG